VAGRTAETGVGVTMSNIDPLLEPLDRGLTIPLADGGHLYCADDDFTDPWAQSDCVLMLHGIAEHGGIWRGWVPHLARRHRILRPDLRGSGRSAPLPTDRAFGITDWADDIEALVASLGVSRVHLVATKLGAQVAFVLAERQRPWVASMTLAGMLPSPSAALGPWLDDFIARIEAHGVADWVNATMAGRMGASLSPAALAWWTQVMSAAPKATVLASLRMLPTLHGPATPELVACPALFIAAATKPPPGSYNQQPDIEKLRALQQRVPRSQMQVVDADSFHISATHPDACAALTARFLDDISTSQR
jgi:3-oxoadipate enol-lactonase